jgi:hypothetical protein
MSHRGHPVQGKPNATQRPITPLSQRSSRAASLDHRQNGASKQNEHPKTLPDDDDDFSDWDVEEDEMDDRRSPLHRPTDGRSHQPLLHKDSDLEPRGRSRGSGYNSPEPPERPPLFTRRSTMRSRSPDTQAKLATRKKYTYAAFFLGLSLVSFVIQTETAVYIQHELGWDKAYCML